MTLDRLFAPIFALLCSFPLTCCTYMSQSGPQKDTINGGEPSYTLISVKTRADLPSQGRSYGLGQMPPKVRGNSYSDRIRARDSLQFTITDLTEASPFYSKGDPFSYGPLEVPGDGRVSIPYVGEVQVIDKTMAQIATSLNEKLKPISNTAQAAVSRSGRLARTANVMGEVKRPGPLPLERSDINSLDLLAASGGPDGAEHLYKYTLRRDGRDYTFDYQGFRQHAFPIEEGDLLSVNTDMTNRFYVLGAINKPTTVPFPVPAPTLADALGAATGLDEKRSDPSGVFIFRKGDPDLVYTINLKDPGAMLLAQRFAIRGEDIVYVTEAPLVRWSRLISQIAPVSQTIYYLDRVSGR